jgi:phytoene/squalene synthetase
MKRDAISPANEALSLLGQGKSYLKSKTLREVLVAFIVLNLGLARIEGRTDIEIANEILDTIARELDGFHRERATPKGLWRRLVSVVMS